MVQQLVKVDLDAGALVVELLDLWPRSVLVWCWVLVWP